MSVSHDLRTPLTTLAGYAETLADPDAARALDPEAVQQAGAIMGAEAARLERMVADLLTLARLEADEVALDIRTLDAVSYTHLDVYKRQAPHRGRPRRAGAREARGPRGAAADGARRGIRRPAELRPVMRRPLVRRGGDGQRDRGNRPSHAGHPSHAGQPSQARRRRARRTGLATRFGAVGVLLVVLASLVLGLVGARICLLYTSRCV